MLSGKKNLTDIGKQLYIIKIPENEEMQCQKKKSLMQMRWQENDYRGQIGKSDIISGINFR